MKARVKATGEIVEISEDCSYLYSEDSDMFYTLKKLEFLNVKEKSFPKDTPDYWTRLEHTYVGMFMKSFLDNFDGTATMEQLSDDAIALAHALVEKMKESV